MLNRAVLLEEVPKAIGRLTPDAITASILMMAGLAAAAVALGNSAATVAEAWYRGLWMLLPFTMQMTLIIVLSAVVGLTPLFRRAIGALSRLPQTRNQVVMAAALTGAVLSYLNWGLGMTLSPIATIYFAREAERKGIAVDFLFLLATVWGANAAWQFGLSSSAPLLMATPGHFLEATTGVMPLSTTIWSAAAILDEVLYLAAAMAAGCFLMPANPRPLSAFPEAHKFADAAIGAGEAPQGLSEKLERQSWVALVFAAALAAWLYVHFFVKRLSLDINSLNAIFLTAAFVLHGNVHRFTRALEKAIASAWPVVVIYHLYAGVAGLIQYTTLGEKMATFLVAISTPLTFPTLAALSGTVVAMFVPSSGGQWAIQGFVTAKASMAMGLTVQRGLLALSVGDHMGNLISPFWYMVVAGIARVNFREVIGYGLIFAAIWFVIGVVVFTFAPC